MKHLLQTLYVKVESTYGVSSAPDVTNIVLAQNLEVNPMQMQTDDFAPVSGSFGKHLKILGPTWCTVQFDILVAPGGAPIGVVGSIPRADPVLRAAALSRVITPAESINYLPISRDEESVSMVYFVDKAKFILTGVRGDIEWVFEAGKAVVMRFRGMGLRAPMLDETPAAYALPANPRPLAMTRNNSSVRLNATYELRCSSMNLKLGNKVEYINRSNQEEVIVSDRETMGSITFELPTVAQQNFIGTGGFCNLEATPEMDVRFGTTSPFGSKFNWYFPKVQLLNPRMSGDKGTTMLTCDLHIVDNVFAHGFY